MWLWCAYIVAKGIINVTGTNANNRMYKKLTFKNSAEDLEFVMPM